MARDVASLEKFYIRAIEELYKEKTTPTNFFSRLLFGWHRYRYLWRIKLIYSIMVYTILTICVFIWLFYFFARRMTCETYKRCGYFHNYECSAHRFKFVTISLFVQSWMLFTQALFAILEIQLLKIFLHTTMREVMSVTKKRTMRLGCLTKYVPWLIAIFHLIWFGIMMSSVVYLLIGGCSKRLNETGVQAVLNCRLYFDRCCKDAAGCAPLKPKDLFDCNSLNFLRANGFLVSPTKFTYVDRICDYVKSPKGALSDADLLDEAFIVGASISDFEKTFITLLSGSGLMFVVITVSLIVVKLSTPIESFFFQVSDENEFFVIHIVRKLLTPWG